MNACRYLQPLIFAVLFAVSAGLSSCASRETRVLFLGNSLTYVGNLPEVLKALCSTSGRRCGTEMVAEGGATLSQRVEDKTLTRTAESRRKFDYLVLQERGGDYISISSRLGVTRSAQSAAEALSQSAIQNGMKPILLGTYQDHPRASEDLVAAEAKLATTLNITHVPVSNYFACGRRLAPSLRWLDPDGGHPGPDLTLLMAVLLYQELFKTHPSARPISVHAPIYGPMNSPSANSLASAQTVNPQIVRTVSYDSASVSEVIKLSQALCK
jgi:hypothetical protein